MADSSAAYSEEFRYRQRLAKAIGKDYELQDPIGHGGFGVVHRALDKRLDRSVAIKALRHDLFPTPDLLERFDREAKAVARLRHPNILPVYAVGMGEGITFMVMPLVEGESLQARLDREHTIPISEVMRITSEAAAALEAAHKIGLVHRDVKPANIMLEGEERRVLLMDFGLAKAVAADDASLTGIGITVGTPAYMSPEQLRGEKDVDGRSDVYSLGAVAYQMLSGRQPFSADNLHELVFKQVTQDAEDLNRLVAGIPPNVGVSIMRCLAKDRQHRWQTAADLRSNIAASSSSIASFDPTAELDEESWLSRRGPYIALLSFLLFFAGFYEHLTELDYAYDEYAANTRATQFAYARITLNILLVAAAADLAFRIVVRLMQRQSLIRVVLFVASQPKWWQTWYPRPLRVPDSVWDRLPLNIKLLRTVVWLQLILVPAGGMIVFFVLPTFASMLHTGLGDPFPWFVEAFSLAVKGAFFATPLTALYVWWQADWWRDKHGVPRISFLASLFELRGSYWQGSRVRVMLKD